MPSNNENSTEYSPLFRVVLVEPEIPNNTGNIGRTCICAQCELHLVGPLGYSLDDKYLKRAGLDYWPHLKYQSFDSWAEWEKDNLPADSAIYLFSTKATRSLYEIEFRPGDFLVFGKESKGLNPALLERFPNNTFRIPMYGSIRSLNLANAVSIAIYEGVRQNLSRFQDCKIRKESRMEQR